MLLDDQSMFIDYLGQNGLRFQKIKMVRYNFSLYPEKDSIKMLTFESLAKMLIDDED